MSAASNNVSGRIHGSVRAILPLAAVFALCALFAVRTQTAEDLGYHLAYGEQFWQTGRPVDHSPQIYTLPPADTPAAERPEPGPGCWYDDRGRYRFPNANWLTQVLFYGIYFIAGEAGLGALLVVLVTVLTALAAVFMRRLGLGPLAIAAGLMLIVMVGYSRFQLRPELAGYAILTAQACVLGRVLSTGGISRKGIAVLIGLQILLVNLHSYFLLGIAISICVLTDLAVRWLGSHERDTAAALRRVGAAAAGQVAACFLNPWTWRIAVLPLQTLFYLRRHEIAGGPGEHPWSRFGEFRRTFSHLLENPLTASDWTFVAVLAVAAAGLVLAARKKSPGCALLILGGAAVAMSMRRNMVVGTLIMIPPALSVAAPAIRGLFAKIEPAAGWILAGALVISSSVASILVTTDYIYEKEEKYERFGLGFSRLHMPVAAAEWLNQNKVRGRVWCRNDICSNLHFLTRPHCEIHMLTNSWAIPPAVMARIFEVGSGKGEAPFDSFADRYDISAVVTGPDSLCGRLAAGARWVPVHVQGNYVVFLRADGPDGVVAARSALSPANMDPRAAAQRTIKGTRSPIAELRGLGRIFLYMNWPGHAAVVFRKAAETSPDRAEIWNDLGMAYHRFSEQVGGTRYSLLAVKSFKRALQLEPGNPDYLRNLQTAERRGNEETNR